MLLILPVGDVTPRKGSAIANYLLIGANLFVYVWVSIYLPNQRLKEAEATGTVSEERQRETFFEVREETFKEYALVPAEWKWDSPNSWLRTFSSMFLHANIFHLLGNLLFLFIAGPAVEERLGHWPYLFLYLACGVAGAFAHMFTPWGGDPTIGMVGASGAISGVIGAYLLFYPGSQIQFALVLAIFVRYFNLPSWGAIGLWLTLQILVAVPQLQGKAPLTNVAVLAHLGGFAAGLVLGILAALFGVGRRREKK